MFPFLLSAILLGISGLMFLFFSIETLTEEEKERSRKMREDVKNKFSFILSKSISQRDLEEQLLVKFNEQSSPRYLFKQRDFLLTILLFGLFSFIQMGYDTILPVALALPSSLGGMELDKEEISMVSGISSLFQLALGIYELNT